MAYKRLGEFLTGTNIITEAQLEEALEKSKKDNRRLGETLIDMGLINENDLLESLKLQLGVDSVDFAKTPVPQQMSQVLTKNIAKKYDVVPVKVVGDTLYLAMNDPLNFPAIDSVKSATKKKVVPLIATKSSIEKTINILYGSEGVTQAVQEMQKTVATDSSVQIRKNDIDDDNAAPAIRLVNSILERAMTDNASDIHIEPREGVLVVRMRIDGVLHTVMTFPPTLHNAVISRIKIMGDMDIAERRIPLDGRSNIRLRGRDIDLRISTIPTKYGEKVVIRFLEKSKGTVSSTSIGLDGRTLEDYKRLTANSNGVILIAGPTGSGKSTTMYSMVSDLNDDEVNIITLEDPIEYDIDGVNQVQVNEKIGMTFASGLRSILRQDPDIISVGEIRDGETAQIAMQAAITGHLVISTIHTNSAIATIDRLTDIGVEPYLVSAALKGVISQRLVRRICPYCKEEYTPSNEELEQIGIDPEKVKGHKFYHGAGCSECMNTGYKGRIGVFETLILSKKIKNAIRSNVAYDEIEKLIYQTGFVPIEENCRTLVMEGTTTAAEILRVFESTDK